MHDVYDMNNTYSTTTYPKYINITDSHINPGVHAITIGSFDTINNIDDKKEDYKDKQNDKKLKKNLLLSNDYEPIMKIENQITELNNKLRLISNINNLKTLAIKEIKHDNKNQVLIVTFEDGDIQKAVKDVGESNDIETAILVCISKHIFGGQTNLYNCVRYISKIKDLKENSKSLQMSISNKIKLRREKRLEKKKIREAKKREERIEEMKEAYIRATKESLPTMITVLDTKEDK